MEGGPGRNLGYVWNQSWRQSMAQLQQLSNFDPSINGDLWEVEDVSVV